MWEENEIRAKHTTILGTFGGAVGFISAWAQIISASDWVCVVADGTRQADIIGLQNTATEERGRG